MQKLAQFGTLLVFLIIVGLIVGVFFFVRNTQTNVIGLVTARTGDSSDYPDTRLTPGDVITTDSTIVCVSGYAKRTRNVPDELKKKVYNDYDLPYPQSASQFQIDHLIPLELGGSNDLSNLWPQATNIETGFDQKNKLEQYLHDSVCDGSMTLSEAQSMIRNDWLAAYKKLIQ
jgi:hypothetical protein